MPYLMRNIRAPTSPNSRCVSTIGVSFWVRASDIQDWRAVRTHYFRTMDGSENTVRIHSIVFQAPGDYVLHTKLWSTSAKAHCLPEPTAIIYQQNSTVSCHNWALTLRKGADVFAPNRIAHASVPFALVAGKCAICDRAWTARRRSNDFETALTRCFVSATKSEAALPPSKDQ